jgi:hypothetical protein
VGWLDLRTSQAELYVSRLDASGAVAHGWPMSGSIAAPAAVDPGEIVMVDGGPERAIIVWTDRRYGSSDIFAEAVVPGPPGPPRPLADVYDGTAQFGITQIRPNPTRGAFWALIELSEGGPATMELFDIAGRVVEEMTLSPPGPVRGAVQFDTARRMSPGVYWLRLTQAGRAASARVVVSD